MAQGFVHPRDLAVPFIALLLFDLSAFGVPIPRDKTAPVVSDRANFIPNRKHLVIPGKIVAILLEDGQPILSTEGRSGPPDQLCVAWGGGSYRWVYVPVVQKAMIQNLQVPLSNGTKKIYPSLSMASPTTVKQWGIDAPFALVEIEVNDGEGSPATDSFVATKMKKLDGGKEYPIQVASVIGELKKQYETQLVDKQKEVDAAMVEAGKKNIEGSQSHGTAREGDADVRHLDTRKRADDCSLLDANHRWRLQVWRRYQHRVESSSHTSRPAARRARHSAATGKRLTLRHPVRNRFRPAIRSFKEGQGRKGENLGDSALLQGVARTASFQSIESVSTSGRAAQKVAPERLTESFGASF